MATISEENLSDDENLDYLLSTVVIPRREWMERDAEVVGKRESNQI